MRIKLPLNQNISPPNGGYGWVIVFCSALSTGLVSSVVKSAGLIYVAVLDEYPKAGRELVATMATIVRGIMFLIGVLSVNIAERYSYRAVVFIGALIASIGLIVSSLVNNIELLVFTFGGVTGLGSGLVHAPSIGIIGAYFTTKRSTAMGVMLFFSGIFTAIMPPILQCLMNEYGLRGALLIWGGSMLHICAASLLLRQPTWVQDKKESEATILLPQSKQRSLIQQNISLFKDPIFLLLLSNRIAFFFHNVAVIVIIPDFIQKEAAEVITIDQIALLLSALAFGDLLSRGMSGFFLDYFSKRKKVIYLTTLLGIACNTLFFQWATTLVPLIISCTAYGILSGTGLLLTYLLVFDFFPTKGQVAHALQQSLTGLVLFLEGPVIGGLWYLTTSYNSCWDFFTIILVLSVILWLFKLKQ